MKIWAHTLVMNEERYVWFAVMSVINYVDKILIWDTGSSDRTVEIIKGIKKKFPDKVIFKQVGRVDINEFTQVRQQMLDKTKSDWFILLDGDEVWWDSSIRLLVSTIKKEGKKLDSIANRYYNVVSDIFHYQEETAGKYKIDGKSGHLTIRAMNKKISGLQVSKPHGQQGFFDGEGTLVQERAANKRRHLDVYYMHFTNLPRSTSRNFNSQVPKRKKKLKYEIGKRFPLDFYYPEVFFEERPVIVSCPWENIDGMFYAKSALLTVPRKIKRRLVKGPSGY